MKILILKPSSLGDVVQALPVLRLLKQHLPASEIYWWLDANLLPLLNGDPDLSGVIAFERDRWSSPANWGQLLAAVRRLRAVKFDWVIDLQSLARSGMFAWLANGALMIGLDDPREGARGFYDIIVRRKSFHAHAVDWYLEALRLLDVPVHDNFTWLPKQEAVAAAIRRKWRIDGARWMAVQPGARWANKRWPVEYFAELVRHLARDEPGLRFVVLGSSADSALGDKIAEAAPERVLDLTGKTSLCEMVEWLRVCDLIVTNDTGPMHIAAALGKPVVGLFGPTEPRRTGPYGQVDRVLQLPSLPCVPCLKDHCTYAQPMECLRGISPARVHAEIQQRLKQVKDEDG